MTGLWSWLDAAWHALGLPGTWVCARYDRALGLSWDKIRQTSGRKS